HRRAVTTQPETGPIMRSEVPEISIRRTQSDREQAGGPGSGSNGRGVAQSGTRGDNRNISTTQEKEEHAEHAQPHCGYRIAAPPRSAGRCVCGVDHPGHRHHGGDRLSVRSAVSDGPHGRRAGREQCSVGGGHRRGLVIATGADVPGGPRPPGGPVARKRPMKTLRSDERGTSSVEFILIAPFLLLILFASVELSRAWFTMNLLTTAAREGVRAAVTAAPAQVTAVGNARLTQMLGAGNYTGSVVCMPNAAGVCGQDSRVVATVSMNFNTVVPNLLWMIPQPLVLQQTASMTFENWQ